MSKYEILQNVRSKGWEIGDIVSVVGSFKGQEDLLKEVSEDTPHKHVLVVIDEALTLTGK